MSESEQHSSWQGRPDIDESKRNVLDILSRDGSDAELAGLIKHRNTLQGVEDYKLADDEIKKTVRDSEKEAKKEVLPEGSVNLTKLVDEVKKERGVELIDLGRYARGQDYASDLVVDEKQAAVSRFHALINRRGGEYYLRDRMSLNGTYVSVADLGLVRMLAEGENAKLSDGDVFYLAKPENANGAALKFRVVDGNAFLVPVETKHGKARLSVRP